MKRRFLSALLCLALLMPLLPATALAGITGDYTMDFTARTAQAWAGGKIPATEDCSGTDWNWVANNRTLTLFGLDFTTRAATAMKLPADTTLVLQSGTDNIVTCTYSGTNSTYGIQMYGGLRVTGGGALTATGGTVDASLFDWSRGIYVGGLLTLDGGSVTGIGGMSTSDSYGIWAVSVVVSDGALTGVGGDADHTSYGIDIPEGSGGTLRVSGGTVTAKGYTSALHQAPTLTGVAAVGSPSYDGAGEVLYVPADNDAYKYFRILPQDEGDVALCPETLPSAALRTAYTASLWTEREGYPYNDGITYSVEYGALPPGVTLTNDVIEGVPQFTATLSGTPTKAGTYTFIVLATDNNTIAVRRSYSITVASDTASFSGSSISGGGDTGNYQNTWNDGKLTIPADINKFASITVDNVQLTQGVHFGLTSGSTVITFTPEYLATLQDGAHTIRVQFTDGRYDGTFTTPFTDAVAASPVVDVPNTGDAPWWAKIIELVMSNE